MNAVRIAERCQNVARAQPAELDEHDRRYEAEVERMLRLYGWIGALRWSTVLGLLAAAVWWVAR